MNSTLKLMLTAAILLFVGSDVRATWAQANKSATDRTSKTAQGSDCPVLTSAMVDKVMGEHLNKDTVQQILPMYGGASGSGCTYHGPGVRIDFAVYTEASTAVAKRAFYTYSAAADESKGKPSIGESAYWVTDQKQEPYLYVLKGKTHFSIGMRPGNETQMKSLASAAASGI